MSSGSRSRKGGTACRSSPRKLAKALVEAGTSRAWERSRASEPPESHPESGVPSTLRGLLMARLDRLGRARQTAQLAAALGREFRMDVLSAVSAADSHVVSNDVVQELVLAGLVHPAGGSGNAYAFKHALIRDAAYDLASAPARQSAHARIAATLERQFHRCHGDPAGTPCLIIMPQPIRRHRQYDLDSGQQSRPSSAPPSPRPVLTRRAPSRGPTSWRGRTAPRPSSRRVPSYRKSTWPRAVGRTQT